MSNCCEAPDDFQTADEGEWSEETDNEPTADVQNCQQEEAEDMDQQPPAVQEVALVAVPAPAAVQGLVAIPAAVQEVAVAPVAVPKSAFRRKKSVQEVSKLTRCSQRLLNRKVNKLLCPKEVRVQLRKVVAPKKAAADVPNGHQEAAKDSTQQPLAVQEVAVPAVVQELDAAVPNAASSLKKSVQEVSVPMRCSRRLMDRKAKPLCPEQPRVQLGKKAAKVQRVGERRSCREASKVATKRISHCFSKERWVVWDRFCPTAP